jgi:glycerol-3-phosphate dehydrogenase
MKGTIDESTQGIKTDLSGVLQKVSREHHIDHGPGGVTVVAGGKYTTHRTMGEEIVDFVIKHWREDKGAGPVPAHGRSKTKLPINPRGTPRATLAAKREAGDAGVALSEELWMRYGADTLELARIGRKLIESDPHGFPYLEAQLRFAVREEMVMHLEDFLLRRSALFLARADHGLPWLEKLALIWAEERGLPESEIPAELERTQAEIARLNEWKARIT